MRAIRGKKRSNMRDVARLADVSVATVSRVLNGSARVSNDTRERVSRAVKALQFVPSPAARAINSGRSHMVGALVPTLSREIFARFLDEMEDELSDHGLSLVVATTDYDPQKEFQRARDLLNLGVEALVVSGLGHSAAFHELVESHQIPVISTSRFDADAKMPTIGYDNRAAAQSALSYLKDAGHDQIAVLSGPLANNDRMQERVAGLKAAAPDLEVYEAGRDLEQSVIAAAEVLAKRRGVTALLCLSDVVAQGALIACKRTGWSVPEHASVIGIDDLPNSAYTDPPLTSVHLPVGRMGRVTASSIAACLETGEAASSVKIDSHVVQRSSVAAPRS